MGAHQNMSRVEVVDGTAFLHHMHILEDIKPELQEIKGFRDANFFRQGWTDKREMKLNAKIPAIVVWQVENVGCPCCRGRKYNLYDNKEYREFLAVHPEYVVAPIDTGRSGKIIIK